MPGRIFRCQVLVLVLCITLRKLYRPEFHALERGLPPTEWRPAAVE